MAVSQAAMQSTPRIAAVIFLTAATRITIAVFVGSLGFSPKDADDRRKEHQEKPAAEPANKPGLES